MKAFGREKVYRFLATNLMSLLDCQTTRLQRTYPLSSSKHCSHETWRVEKMFDFLFNETRLELFQCVVTNYSGDNPASCLGHLIWWELMSIDRTAWRASLSLGMDVHQNIMITEFLSYFPDIA